MDFLEKLHLLRRKMDADGIGIFIMPSADPHQSPSVCAHWKTVQWLTGFTGSLATCIVSKDNIALWTDGRYVFQAQRELQGKNIEQHMLSDPNAPDYCEWIHRNMGDGEKIAIDKELISVAEYRKLEGRLTPRFIIEDKKDYIGEIWNDRSPISPEPLFELPESYAGISRAEKINTVRQSMERKDVAQYLTSSLDAVAWLTNLRGHDNPIYPLFHSYLHFTKDKTILYADASKISVSISEELKKDGIILRNTAEIFSRLPLETGEEKIYIDPYKISTCLYNALSPSAYVVEGMDMITYIKSMKSEAERHNIMESNIKECTALCRLIKYIKDNVGKKFMNEYMIGQQVNEFRSMDPLFLQPANIPIVAVGENAALPHYKPQKEKSREIVPQGFLLFDLCAHYLTGSTDITRTIQVGPLSEEMRRDYTNVLKAHISLAMMVFPFGTTGFVIDGVVKSHQWRHYMDYNTGTGHGIGYCLDIHEGPCKIVNEFTPLFPYAMTTPLDTGMLFSNEPGVYKKDRFGVRLENNIMVREDRVNEFGRFLRFETLTYCPFELGAIVKEMLSIEELEWLNQYHKKTYELLSPHLTGAEREWLKRETREL
ncbi:MAG: aminopeptidase P family N-terminal domain-containing protein [bacterium]|nr:aminopeptidase P family N-terminal domain-containing protein [bacterium]